jgi:hypothetical protein
MELLGFTKLTKLSEKLEEYVKRTEEKTGRPALITNNQDEKSWPYGINARFILDPDYIFVEIYEDKYLDFKGEIEQEEIEYTIAHEVTHGLLAYKEKYCQFKFVSQYSELDEKSASLLFTMIEDIVVSKIIYENNFQQYPRKYISQIEYEIECTRVGIDAYKPFTPLEFKYRYMVFRYILAWGMLKYVNSNKLNDEKILNKFLNVFQKSYYKQYKEAEKIKKIILENNIFITEGFNNAIKKSLELWNLTNLVEIYQI